MIIAGIVGLIAQYYSFSNRLQFAYGVQIVYSLHMVIHTEDWIFQEKYTTH